jgi:hypothetical protein
MDWDSADQRRESTPHEVTAWVLDKAVEGRLRQISSGRSAALEVILLEIRKDVGTIIERGARRRRRHATRAVVRQRESMDDGHGSKGAEARKAQDREAMRDVSGSTSFDRQKNRVVVEAGEANGVNLNRIGEGGSRVVDMVGEPMFHGEVLDGKGSKLSVAKGEAILGFVVAEKVDRVGLDREGASTDRELTRERGREHNQASTVGGRDYSNRRVLSLLLDRVMDQTNRRHGGRCDKGIRQVLEVLQRHVGHENIDAVWPGKRRAIINKNGLFIRVEGNSVGLDLDLIVRDSALLNKRRHHLLQVRADLEHALLRVLLGVIGSV